MTKLLNFSEYRRGEELRGQGRSQVQLGNEGNPLHVNAGGHAPHEELVGQYGDDEHEEQPIEATAGGGFECGVEVPAIKSESGEIEGDDQDLAHDFGESVEDGNKNKAERQRKENRDEEIELVFESADHEGDKAGKINCEPPDEADFERRRGDFMARSSRHAGHEGGYAGM